MWSDVAFYGLALTSSEAKHLSRSLSREVYRHERHNELVEGDLPLGQKLRPPPVHKVSGRA